MLALHMQKNCSITVFMSIEVWDIYIYIIIIIHNNLNYVNMNLGGQAMLKAICLQVMLVYIIIYTHAYVHIL